MNVLLYGLQRSGTNYLIEILKTDPKINFINGSERNVFTHKHYRFHNIKKIIPHKQFYPISNIKSVDDIFNKIQVDKIIVIEKNIYHWYDSILNWATQCNWRFINKEFSEEFIEDHYYFHNFFKNNDKIIYILYEDLLFNKNNVINNLKLNGINVTGDFLYNNIPLSQGNTESFKKKYTNYKSKYEKDIKRTLKKIKQKNE